VSEWPKSIEVPRAPERADKAIEDLKDQYIGEVAGISAFTNQDLSKGGVKYDTDKLRMDLIPPRFIRAVAAVLTYGAGKYTRVTEYDLSEINEWAKRNYGHFVTHINLFTRSAYVDHATNGTLGIPTQSSQRSSDKIEEIGKNVIQTKLKQIIKEESVIQKPENEMQQLIGEAGYFEEVSMRASSQTSELFKLADVQYAIEIWMRSEPFISTTTKNRDTLEDCFVVGATTASECLKKAWIKCAELLNTYRIHPQISCNFSNGKAVITNDGANNWRLGMPFGRIYAAAQRHLWAWWDGEDIDPESGLNHLDHAACNLAFLIELIKTHPEMDDRSKK